MRRRILTSLLLVFAGVLLAMAANKKTSVKEVTEAVTVTDDVDYIITSATPFGENGTIDIANTEHAVVILSNVRPSAAIKLLAAHVTIDGKKAVNNTNCQVKLYNLGAIILPYGNSVKPLTVYSEQNFGGEAVNSFGTENSGGYMNTLTDAKLNNKIRSFRLKRGYMVTFSTLPQGRGYSRCFIAADADIEVAELPTVLDKRISSYRVFKWYDAGKKQLANSAGDKNALDALNVQSTYDWGQGNTSLQPDYEWVPNHIYEDWPSSATIGGTTQSPHTKNNNEPRNSSDDHPQDLATILGNWENMMRTGLRLCSPASWDGSDYWNATGFLAEFLDSIDARGWRCDIIDLHCYWPDNNFGNIKNWVDKYKRPVWISEWCWGASWSNNGAFASGVTETQVKTALQGICSKLNNWNYVERYYYWNSERDPSKLYKNGKLTPAGEYYASMNSGLGYNGKYDFVPTLPRQYAPSKFSVSTADGKAVIKWYDPNGEYNQLMQLERKLKGGQWEVLADIEQKEKASNYTFTDENASEDTKYRLHLIDLNGTSYYTNNDMDAGDAITSDGQTRYVGGNLLTNGDFNLGTTNWTAGTGVEIGKPYFQVIPVGGIDNGSYLQAYQSAAIGAVGSLKRAVDIEPQTDYIFRVATCNGNANEKLSLSADGKTESKVVATLSPSTSWQLQEFIFNSGEYSHAIVAFRNLGTAQIDKVELRRIYSVRDDAVADGAERDRIYAQLAEDYETEHPNFDLSVRMAEEMEALLAMGVDPAIEMTYEPASVQPQSPSFATATGWTTAAGTYKGGDQRLNTVRGKTCWNAWWANVNAATGAKNTMEIKQEVTGLPQGIYTMQCKATTQHYCLSDQHGYMVVEGDTVTTTKLKADYADLPAVADVWETLTTLPVYVPEGGSVVIGFTGSKQGATDNAWHEYGNFSRTDKREGWWCATDFQLLYHPMKKVTATPGQWNTLCLPYSFTLPQGAKFYQIAGILKDHTKICLEEVTDIPAGKPVIYRAETENLTFFEYGEKTKTPLNYKDENNLRGFFETSAKAPVDSYVLYGDTWYCVKTDRPALQSYAAIIYKLEGMTELDSWSGLTMPIVDSDYTAIGSTSANEKKAADTYTLGGRRTTTPRGIVIETNGRQTRKVIKRTR